MPLDVVFMGTPDFAVPTLEAVAAAGHRIVAAYTRAPRPAGRGLAERRSPVHEAAERLGAPVLTPARLREAADQAAFAAHAADVAVVVAYGLILPEPVLAAPRFGCLNLHASLLPRWRGAAPINRAVMAGDAETGAMVMRMDAGLDTGPVCLAERTPIGADETAGELHDRLAPLGAALMVRAISALEAGALACTPQPAEGVTYAAKLTNAETRIDWSLPAKAVHDHVRGLSPFPGAFCEIERGGKVERLKVLRTAVAAGSGVPGTAFDDALTVACGAGAVRLVTVQRAGKGPMAAADFLRGTSVAKGTRLG